MKQWIRQTDEVVKRNLRQLAVFEILYRLAAGTFYIRLAGSLLRFSLRMAGYSYLTMSNLRAFLLCPASILSLILLLLTGMALMVFEIGGLLTAYQASAYSRRVDSLEIFRGACLKCFEEWKKGSWQLLLLALADYLMMNGLFLFRVITRIRPFDFIMSEILHTSWIKWGLLGMAAGLVLLGIPCMFVFFACMVEQKYFRDGLRRSMALTAGRWPAALGLLLAVNAALAGGLIFLYIAIMGISAILVTISVDSYAAMAVLLEVGRRAEVILLCIGSAGAGILDLGVLTVVYYRLERNEKQDPLKYSSLPQGLYKRRRSLLAFTGILLGTSVFLLFDLAYNGSQADVLPLHGPEITAHRGSSLRAPENTLGALEAAIREMADFAEIDVQLTADGVIVLCHDRNVRRVTGVDRRLEDMTWQQVQELDAGDGEGIPSLEQALELAKGRIRLNIELKNLGNDSGLPEQTAALIKEHDMEEQCVITSVKPEYLQRVKAADPDIRTGYILAAAYGRFYEQDWVDFISLRSSLATRRLAEEIHENGKALHVWTVNSRRELEQMKAVGADNIITDDPARAREILYEEDTARNLLEYLRAVLR